MCTACLKEGSIERATRLAQTQANEEQKDYCTYKRKYENSYGYCPHFFAEVREYLDIQKVSFIPND